MPIINITPISEDGLSEIKIKPKAERNPLSVNYVNNKDLYAEFVAYHERKLQWIAEGKPGHPPLTNKIGEAILQIARRRCFSRQFVSYTYDWKEEMVEDAVLAATANCHNFNPEKSNNPFAYLTTIVTNAIIQRIKIEHKQNYIKLKSYDMSHGFQGVCDENVNEEDLEIMAAADDMFKDRLEKIAAFEQSNGLIQQPTRTRIKKGEGVLTFEDISFDSGDVDDSSDNRHASGSEGEFNLP